MAIATTTTFVTPLTSSSVYGQPVTFTVQVDPVPPATGNPTGQVAFTISGGPTLTSPLNTSSRQASITIDDLSVGEHTITATYQGNSTYDPSSTPNSTTTHTVGIASTRTSIVSSPSTLTAGQPVTFTAKVTALPPSPVKTTGTVRFTFSGPTTFSLTGTLGPNERASVTTAALLPGVYTVTATCNGTANFSGSTSAPSTRTVSGASSTAVVSQSSTSTGFGAEATFSAQVAATPPGTGTPTGTVTFTITGPTTLALTGTVNASGLAAVVTSALPVGSYSVAAAYPGDATFAASTSTSIAHSVTAAPTTTVVDQSSTTSIYGTEPVFTARVTANAPSTAIPVGTVTFNVTGPSSFTLTAELDAAGEATIVGRLPSVGSYTVTASYTSGDTSFQPSTSALITHAVSGAATAITLSQPSMVTVYGQDRTVGARVTADAPSMAAPTGAVRFELTGPVSLTLTAQLDASGEAFAAGRSLPAGSYSVTATYLSDTAEFGSSVSSAIPHTVNPAPTTATVAQGSPNSTYGEQPVFTATVIANPPGSAIPTGEMRFEFTGPATLTVVGIIDETGQAVVVGEGLPAGTYSVTATYLPDTGNFAGDVSNPDTHTVRPADTTTTVTQSQATAYYGEEPVFTAHVTADPPSTAVPAGTVTFQFTGPTTFSLTRALDLNGQAAVVGRGLAAGDYTLTARYAGKTDFTGSVSDPVTRTVLPTATTTTILSPPTPSAAVSGQTITIEAQVRVGPPGAGAPAGTVNFVINGPVTQTLPAAVDPVTGIATVATSTLPPGAYTVAAAYRGDGNFADSSSVLFNLTVTKAGTTTAILTPPTLPSVVRGENAAFAARVRVSPPGSGAPTGTVDFQITGPVTTSLAGTVDPTTGIATASTRALPLGSYTVTAAYGGDADRNASTSTSLGFSVIVTETGTATTVVNPTPTAAEAGDLVTVAAQVVVSPGGPGTPTGTVTFTFTGSTTLTLPGTLDDTGRARASTAALPAGPYTLFASYNGDATFNPSSSAGWSLTSAAIPTTTAVQSPPTPSSAVVGQNVSITAQVTGPPGSGAPTGTVIFRATGPSELILTGTLDRSGQATVNTNALLLGSYSIVAEYQGDTLFGRSTSGSFPLPAGRAATATALTASSCTSVYDENVSFTADVTVDAPGAGTPTGIVTFHLRGPVNLSLSATLDSGGRARVGDAPLPVGTYAVTATYEGDTDFEPSTSDPLGHTVTPAYTTTVLSQTAPTSVYGSERSFLARVTTDGPSDCTPSGTATFAIDGPTTLSVARAFDANGEATAFGRAMPVGTYTVIVNHTPDTASLEPSTSNQITHVITAAATTTTVLSPPTPATSVSGEPVTLTAQVTAGSPSTAIPAGTVTFTIPGQASLTGEVDPVTGQATVTTSALPAGGHPITATYHPDNTNFEPSTSGAFLHMVAAAGSTTALGQSAASTIFGESVTFTAHVRTNAPSAAIPAGIVTFAISDDGPALTASLDPATGQATVTVSSLAAGTHAVTATYAGGTDCTGSVSVPPVTHTVLQASTTTTVLGPPTPPTAVFGDNVVFSARVGVISPEAGEPTGTVSFTISGPTPVNLTGTVNPSTGIASAETTGLPAGPCTVLATYHGDPNFAGSSSALFPLAIQRAGITTVIVSPPTPTTVVMGQTATFTAQVAVDRPGLGAPTGDVDFEFTGPVTTTVPGTIDPATGSASVSTGVLTQGAYTLVARYAGDANHATAASGRFAFAVVTDVPASITTIQSPPTPTSAIEGETVTVAARVVGDPPGARTPTGTVDVTFTGPVTVIVSGALDGSGVATVSTDMLPTGTYALFATYEGDLSFNASGSEPWPLSVTPLTATTTTAILSPPTPATAEFGASVTLAAQVALVLPGTGSPSGLVEFVLTGPTTITLTGTLGPSGQATATSSTVPVGTYSVTAAYRGATGFHPSTSVPLTLGITQAVTATSLTGPASSVYGADPAARLLATVCPSGGGIPSGRVTFDFSGPTGFTLTKELDAGGQATASTRLLSAGTYTITATYHGDGSFSASTSRCFTHTVTPAATVTTVSQPSEVTVYRADRTMTARVTASSPSAAIPTGTVRFDFTGPVTLTLTKELDGNGEAVASGQSLPVGSYSVTVTYLPATDDFASSVPAVAPHTVVPAPTTATLTQSSPTSVYGAQRGFMATVVANGPSTAIPTGSVTFDITGVTTLSVTTELDENGQAVASGRTLPAGTYTATATYTPDADFAGDVSNTVTHTVTAVPTTTTLAESSATTFHGEQRSFTVGVTANDPSTAIPAGTMTLRFAGPATYSLTKALDLNGKAVVVGRELPAGAYTITATYEGDTNFLPSVWDPPLARTVLPAMTTTTILSPPTPSAAVSGQRISFSAAIGIAPPGSGAPTGTVDFELTGPTTITLPATVNPATGVATVDTTSIPPGPYTVVAAYGGDTNFASSASVTFDLTVREAETTTVILSPPTESSVVLGEGAAFAARVRVNPPGSSAPAGTVEFQFDGPVTTSLPGTVNPVTGVASATTDTMPEGSYTVAAVYGDDGSHHGSSSAPFAVDVITTETATITAIASPTPTVAPAGALVTVAAQVSRGLSGGSVIPAGTVTFTLIGPTTLSLTGTLDGTGRTSASTDALVVGTYTLLTSYVGDGTYGPSSSAPWSLTLTPITSTTAVLSPPTPTGAVVGQNVPITAQLTGPPRAGTPTGTVTFTLSGPTPLTLTASVDGSGRATVNTNALSAGSYSVVAEYQGDTRFTASASTYPLPVVRAATTTTVSEPAGSVFQETVTFTAQIAVTSPGSGTPTGIVSFHLTGPEELTLSATVDSSGQAGVSVSTLPVGTYSIVATYDGDAGCRPSTSDPIAHVVATAGTTTVLTQFAPSTIFGQERVFTARVTANGASGGTPTGTVTFEVTGPTGISVTRVLDAAGAAITLGRTLPVGSYQVVAHYTPDTPAFVPSDSKKVTHTVTLAGTTTTLLNPPTPTTSVIGAPVTLTALVAADRPSVVTPSGTVAFTISGQPSLTGEIDPRTGQAWVTTSSLPLGGHTVSATYHPDSSNAGASESETFTHKVGITGTTTDLSQSSPTTVAGESVTFTAQVRANPPTAASPGGIVTFLITHDGPALTASVSPLTGIAAVTVAGLCAGPHDVTATYNAEESNPDFAASSATLSRTVTKAATATALSPSSATSVFGEDVSFTAQVSVVPPGAGSVTGGVDFTFAGPVNETLPASVDGTGQATVVTALLPPGTYAVTATYGGNSDFASSTAAPVSHSVAAAATATTLTSSTSPAAAWETVTFTSTVAVGSPASGTPAGTVTFTITGPTCTTITAAVNPATGIASGSIDTLAPGTYTVRAAYAAGNNDFKPSTSDEITQSVSKAGTETIELTSAPNPSASGQSVTFTATVVPLPSGRGTPTGTVTFVISGPVTVTSTGTVNASGQASVATGSLPVGSYAVSAAYSGDTAFNGSAAEPTVHTVGQSDSITSLLPSPNPPTVGQAVTFTATVRSAPPGAGLPTGTVAFTISGPVTVTLTGTLGTGGHTSVSTTALPQGSYRVTAAYSGDGNFAPSSTAIAQAVNPASKVQTTTALLSSGSPPVAGQAVTFIATVSPVPPGFATPSGTVTFTITGPVTATSTGTVNASRQASATTGPLPAGSYTVIARYEGDSAFNTSTSTAIAQTVNKAATTTTVVSSANPSVAGQSVAFTATVAPAPPGSGTPTGIVTFMAAGPSTVTLTGTVNASGQATATTTALLVGRYRVTATYGGDGNDLSSASTAIVQTVNAGASANTPTTVMSNGGAGAAGDGFPNGHSVLRNRGAAPP